MKKRKQKAKKVQSNGLLDHLQMPIAMNLILVFSFPRDRRVKRWLRELNLYREKLVQKNMEKKGQRGLSRAVLLNGIWEEPLGEPQDRALRIKEIYEDFRIQVPLFEYRITHFKNQVREYISSIENDSVFKLDNLPHSKAMSRGILVLDKDSWPLATELKRKNIRIIKGSLGKSDDPFFEVLLANRILVTRKPKRYLHEASSFDMGIITTHLLKKKKHSDVVRLISEAIIKHSLWTKRHGFIVTLLDSGKTQFKELID